MSVAETRQLVLSVCLAAAAAGLTLMLLVAAATMLDGAFRAILGWPIDIVREVGEFLIAIGVACCLPASLLLRSHITFRALADVRPKAISRAAEIFAAFVVLVIIGILAWQFLDFAIKTNRAGDVTWLLNVPKAPFWFIVDGVLWGAVLVQFFVLIETVLGDPPLPTLETSA